MTLQKNQIQNVLVTAAKYSEIVVRESGIELKFCLQNYCYLSFKKLTHQPNFGGECFFRNSK